MATIHYTVHPCIIGNSFISHIRLVNVAAASLVLSVVGGGMRLDAASRQNSVVHNSIGWL